MGEKAVKGKVITKVLSCLVVFAILMSVFSVAALATDSSNSTASNVTLNLNDEANSSVESMRIMPSGNSDLPDASNNTYAKLELEYANASSPEITNESDEVPDPDLPVINDTDIDTFRATAKTVSAMSSCSYVWIKITDKYCKGYKVYVDGAYQFTEGEGGIPDGYCCFKVTPGYHTFKLTLNGKQVSKGWNCQCGHVYNWVSMNDMIPHWCSVPTPPPDHCDNPPTVNFDKSKYYEGDTVHATVSTIHGSVYYEIKDCSGTIRKSGYVGNGGSIYYTIPSGASECCYWTICFYWDEGTPPLGPLGTGGEVTTASYQCTKCYSFYVCPHETPCKVWINVEDKYCKGYGVYVDGVYQFTEGESGTPDGYCRFWVTPGTHKFELRKDGCSVSKSWYCQCGTSYRWISMNDMDPHWCECNIKPDLVVQDFWWSPTNPKEGDTVTFTVKTKNQGSGSAGGFYVCYYVDGSYYARDYVSSLSAGSTTTTSFSWTADCGSHSIKAVADCYSDVAESNEGNNARTEYINIVCKPDLITQDIYWSPSNPKEGDTVTFSVKTKNQGSESAGGFYVCYYVDGSYYTRDYVSSLSAGSTTTTSFTWTADCGSHSIKAVADCYDAVTESNEGNNARTEYINIVCKPDLVVQDISWSPSNPKQGDTVTVNVKTKNQGSESVGGFYVCYYVDGSYYARDYVSSLSAGSTTTTSFTWTAECGNHAIKAAADCYDAVAESDEENNWRSKGGLNIPCKPDLIVQDISWSPSSPKMGETVTINVKTKNQGSGNVGGFYVCYYVDGSYYDRDYVSSLSDGSTTTTRFTWTAECGNHAIKAVADCYNAVAESNEGNNWMSKGGLNIPCKPDLIIEDIYWQPKNPKQGDNVEFTITVKNQGKGNAGKFLVAGEMGKGHDKLLKSFEFTVPSLAVGKVYTYMDSWKADECGDIIMFAKADVWNAIDEGSDEGNNDRTETINIVCDTKEWSFMVYMDADNDIEWMAVSSGPKGDFLEMSEIGSTEDVNVVVQLDRHGGKDWCYDFGDWTTCKRFKITKNLKPDSEADFNEEVNMGHPNTLYDFITWVKKDYSAQHYCIVLWDHGSGWEGCCKDNTSNDDKLTLQEIKQAFKQAGIKFDVLVFDACIMGNIETVYQLNDYTNTVIASEDVGGHRMSPYDAILQELTKKPNMGWDELGRIWVDEYYKFYKLNYPKYDFSVSKVDTKHIVQLKDSVDTLAKKLIQYWPSYRKEISAARNNAEKYAKSTNHEDEYVDIYDFSQLIKESDVPNDLKNAAGNVIDLINHCVYSKNRFSHPNSKGLSIYFPLKGSAKYKDEYDQLDFAKDTKWDDWLKIYLKENQLPDLERIWITGQDKIKAGETLQWQAYGSYSDGSQKELTSQVSWTVDASDILQNIGNGKFKGLKGGEATIKITYEGKSASKKVTVIEKKNLPPKASFTYEKDGLTAHFTSTSYDPDGEIKKYQWLFGDKLGTTQKNPEHTYCFEGTYKVILIVWDDKGATKSCSEDITVTEPKVPIKVTVKNLNNYPLPGCGGSITVKAHTDIHGKSLEEGSASYYGGEKDLTITLNVPKKAKCITVWQTPKIKDGVQEYWGAMAITPEKKNEYKFVRHTPWITGITINGKSPYSELIDLNSPGWKTFHVQVTNPQIVNRKVKVEAFLDRNEKTPWDFNSNDLQELAPKESKKFGFSYNKEQTEGIWRFRVVVGMYSLDNKYIVTDQHAWTIVLDKSVRREAMIGLTAHYYYMALVVHPEETDLLNKCQEEMEDLAKLCAEAAGESFEDMLASYNSEMGEAWALFKVAKNAEELVQEVRKYLDQFIGIYSLKLISKGAGQCDAAFYLADLGGKENTKARIQCWKSGNIEDIKAQLKKEGEEFAYLKGFISKAPTKGIEETLSNFASWLEKEYLRAEDMYCYLGGTQKDFEQKYNAMRRNGKEDAERYIVSLP